MRAIAVDWSGDTHTARSHIWLAEAEKRGTLTRLESGRDREQILDHLLNLPHKDVVIGLDFAFSFPMWFIHAQRLETAPQLWSHVALHGEEWLRACEPPFWGRPGRRRPAPAGPRLRRTDSAVPRTAGIAPKSIFQVGGAGAVGTGSMRGMPLLSALHASGARIWPFTQAGTPQVVEIYPRLLTGKVRKSNAAARAQKLAEYPRLAREHRARAVASEDAFDAAISALVMLEHIDDLAALPEQTDPCVRLEGRIWHPRWREDPL